MYDSSGSIGRGGARADEIGVPYLSQWTISHWKIKQLLLGIGIQENNAESQSIHCKNCF